jgi:hypothetical protein
VERPLVVIAREVGGVTKVSWTCAATPIGVPLFSVEARKARRRVVVLSPDRRTKRILLGRIAMVKGLNFMRMGLPDGDVAKARG